MSLPCATCKAECCGPVPITAVAFARIETFTEAMSAEDKKRLGLQERGELDCGFLDMDTHRCSIYAARPAVCRLFGKVEGMPCPHGSEKLYHPLVVETLLDGETLENTVMLSTDWRWE